METKISAKIREPRKAHLDTVKESAATITNLLDHY